MLEGASASCSSPAAGIYAFNHIVYGGAGFNSGGTDLVAFYYAESPCFFVEDYNIVFNTKNANAPCGGQHSRCGVDPELSRVIGQSSAAYYATPDYWQQLRLRSDSPATAAADPTIALVGTRNGFTNYPRGSAWDIGGYQQRDGSSALSAPRGLRVTP